jgi:hypothetical protein
MMAVRFLNQPTVKEGIKNIATTVSFAFGFVGVCDLYQIYQGRSICRSGPPEDSPPWAKKAYKFSLLSANMSFILSGATSRPGVYLISKAVGCAFSTRQLERFLGKNTVFAVNPWHPRHLISIYAILWALPACSYSLYELTTIHRWNFVSIKNTLFNLTDSKIRLMALLNTLTSRPVQHLGNQFLSSMVRRV